MNKKLCACKACGQEIAKSAKVCPHCGAKNKKKHPALIAIVVILALMIAVGSNTDKKEPEEVENSGAQLNHQMQENETEANAEIETVEEKNGFSVGEIAELKDVQVSLVSITESMGSSYNTPTEGNVFVLCEFEIANNSNHEINVSSMMSFEAYCDDYACNYSLSALIEKGNKNQLDGTVAPGKRFNGVIGYEVPVDWMELEIQFTPDFWSGKEIIFIAVNERTMLQ